MEADLARFYGIDYRDRWRYDERERPVLTLRMIAVRLRHVPADSAVVRLSLDGGPNWGVEHQLLADIYFLWAKKRHPLARRVARGAKKRRPITPQRRRKLSQARRRARARLQAIDEGAIS